VVQMNAEVTGKKESFQLCRKCGRMLETAPPTTHHHIFNDISNVALLIDDDVSFQW
jgi:hypothetical protein